MFANKLRQSTVPLSPARQALADALATQRENTAGIEAVMADRSRIQGLIDAQAAAAAKLAAIEVAEQSELVAWVAAGQLGDEPEPHHAERKAADRALRIANAQAIHAQKQLADIDTRHAELNAKVRPLQTEVNLARQKVLVDFAETLGGPYHEAVADAFERLHILLALKYVIGQHSNPAEPRTCGFWEHSFDILKGGVDKGTLWEMSEIMAALPGLMVIRERCNKRADAFWEALAGDSEAMLQ